MGGTIDAERGFFGFGALALFWMWTGWHAYRAVRRRDIASHQAWMIRCRSCAGCPTW
ncbi:DUF2306 domain-containing protein [Nocardia sp. NPDC088792]|uniref:DUF2306 domain-containing protein n=1 Tax=Nocardia sp. NPDC088792 TaxID=3364332 RepID=UPI00382736F7